MTFLLLLFENNVRFQNLVIILLLLLLLLLLLWYSLYSWAGIS